MKAQKASQKPKRAYQPAGQGDSRNQGEAHGRARLTEEAVIKCRQLYRDGATVTDLATACDVSVPTLWKCLVGVTWGHVPGAVAVTVERPRKKSKRK